MTGHHPGPPSYYWTITQLKLKAFSNEMNPNPIIFLNQPMTFYYYIKGAITVPTEYIKYYLVYNQYKDSAAFFGILL
jgi:hypothetical protein